MAKIKMEKIADGSKVGFHYLSSNGTVKVIKNEFDSWVIYKDGVKVESYGIGWNALEHAVKIAG